ncbi:aliphatic sulfonate ABC transporter substrate-binding protein [Burkholderia gladioli]|uniref:aliphatic sulfonate ABC transporter substrate-binding protein n=1 Tax=Burkholderia gladioli TaxID=28095 RepID=UPI000D00B662|nr:aliphatic sulfonate ABC transporter substrate-binding protein [Burkholderia gladioli]MBU9215773.1 aliphatic sulfonate ABC transporter substrate-binding protein [Burkholderia gladioli]MDN7721653.1 aliphatic sulfonate ABC transporter substrate-binding protein [Burkholderia gladioli]MDN7800296.1 aliphatic sulfonate ABC transporter substrate-binding protein [Burkholderia gladioli]MDN7917504.1 aliphatic sulfonate ABC transporter substrate-binding protein [Burkholderia gladioli]PRE81179.1 ABC tra
MKPSWLRVLRHAALSIAALAAGVATLASQNATAAPAAPAEIRVDYAYYSPESLVIRHFGWLEDEFKPDHVAIRWLLSLGSNRALEYLNSGATDFGSTAGLAAVLGRANGNPIRAVYVFSRPEWTALVVRKDSPIHTLADLKGRKIAATRGTDPFLFTLRALHTIGLTRDDVELVNLQHPDGRTALANGQVDAWAGLDPHMAAAQVDDGAKLLYRNVGFNTYGFLNVREAFASQYPQAVTRVLKVYEKARLWIVAHPDETARIVADESKVSLPVAKLQLQRNDFSDPVPGDTQRAALKAAAPVLTEEQLVKPGVDPAKVVDALIDPSFARPLAASR